MNTYADYFIKYVVVVLLSLFVTSCHDENKTVEENTATKQSLISNKVTKIDFVEEEKEVDPYKVRLIVSQNFLRFDDGETSSGFILYNRKSKVIYNVNDDDKTIMEIHPKRKPVISPIKLKNRDNKVTELHDAPKINNTVPVKYEFLTNDTVCFGIVAVKDLLPMATNALREFQQALADDSTFTLDNIPADMHDACDLSMNTFTSTRHLKHGFPIHVWSPKGYSRSLVGYDEDFKNSDKLFLLPEHYRSFSVDEFRMGAVSQ
ncbi:MAG: hypothetical protein ACC657_09400 [Thiohalomonadales bacterium]